MRRSTPGPPPLRFTSRSRTTGSRRSSATRASASNVSGCLATVAASSTRSGGVWTELGRQFEIVGHASTVREAIESIPDAEPDVVLLDVHLSDGDGAGVVEALAPKHPDVSFLALSVSDAADDVIAVIRAGA